MKVAVLNSDGNMAKLLSGALDFSGLEAVCEDLEAVQKGRVDLRRFLSEHDPRVVVVDISPPFRRNWAWLKRARASGVLDERAVILTTPHKRLLEMEVGHTGALDVVITPTLLEDFLAKVLAAAPPVS